VILTFAKVHRPLLWSRYKKVSSRVAVPLPVSFFPPYLVKNYSFHLVTACRYAHPLTAAKGPFPFYPPALGSIFHIFLRCLPLPHPPAFGFVFKPLLSSITCKKAPLWEESNMNAGSHPLLCQKVECPSLYYGIWPPPEDPVMLSLKVRMTLPLITGIFLTLQDLYDL